MKEQREDIFQADRIWETNTKSERLRSSVADNRDDFCEVLQKAESVSELSTKHFFVILLTGDSLIPRVGDSKRVGLDARRCG